MRSNHAASGLLALLGVFCCALGEQLSDVPPVKDFLRRTTVSATVIGDYIYIDGGELSELLDGQPMKKTVGVDTIPVNSTISIDMSKSWTNSDVALRTIARPWGSKANQVIWTDSEAGAFYVWGGKWLKGFNMTKNEFWKFTADGKGGGAWDQETAANPSLFDSLEQYEFGAVANTADTGFSIGGVASGWTKLYRAHNQVIPGMVTFNMKTKIWQNGTTGFSPFDRLTSASAQFVPTFGSNGLVMVLGGLVMPLVGDAVWTTAQGVDLQNITFFDPVTKQAYWQLATGSIPPNPRAEFCVAGIENSDGGYEILLAGGHNFRDKFIYGDAYVLSLPGFVWTKVPDLSTAADARSGHTCVTVGKRQVLSIGGTNTAFSVADPAAQGLVLFDMTEMKWKGSYDADAAAYERSADLKKWYNNGSLDSVQWSSDAVQKLFLTAKSTTGTQNPTPSGSSGSSSSSGPSPSDSAVATSSTPVGAIVGGVVGGVAGIALIALAAWLFIRRRRNTDPVPDPGNQDGYSYAGQAPEVKVNPSEMPSPEVMYTTGRAEVGPHAPATELSGSFSYSHPHLSMTTPVEMDASPARS